MAQSLTTQQSYSQTSPPGKDANALEAARAVLDDVFGPVASRRFAVRFWDDSVDEPAEEPRFTIVLESPGALRRMLLPPNELAITESYIFGDIDVEGNLEAAADLGDLAASRLRSPRALFRLMRHLMALPRDSRAMDRRDTPATSHLAGKRHSARRDRDAVRFHYNVGNAFYALWLDARMVYSCAYFMSKEDEIDAAQARKLDYLCRKLRLRPGQRLLDIGCGWGALVVHAAKHFGVRADGITLSEPQAEWARAKIAEAGLTKEAKIDVRDYCEIGANGSELYDAIVSVGMAEHVGRERFPDYFNIAHRALKPGSVFLNQAIGDGVVPRPDNRNCSFIERYVFPDGDIPPLPIMLRAAESTGFEIRDVENLREHYALTLRHWLRRLEANHAKALSFVDEMTYRVWRLYLAGCAHGFRRAHLAVYQTLLAKLDPFGETNLPLTRTDWYAEGAAGEKPR